MELFKVTLTNIVWETNGIDGVSLELPSNLSFKLEAINEVDAIDVAIKKAKYLTGWLILDTNSSVERI